MSQPKHTLGPWSVYEEDGDFYIRYEDGPAHGYLAHLYGQPNVKTNARLIAAAPRMLAYIESCAAANDPEARALLKEIGG